MADLTLQSEEDITLAALNGGINVAGALTLTAKGSVYVDDRFTGV